MCVLGGKLYVWWRSWSFSFFDRGFGLNLATESERSFKNMLYVGSMAILLNRNLILLVRLIFS